MIAFLDADDTWPPETLASQLGGLAAEPNAGAAWGITDLVVRPGGTPPLGGWGEGPQRLLSMGSVVVRREIFARIGDFAPQLKFGEDGDLLVRMFENNIKVHRHENVVLYYHRHTANMTNDHDSARRAVFQVARLSAERRRARQAE